MTFKKEEAMLRKKNTNILLYENYIHFILNELANILKEENFPDLMTVPKSIWEYIPKFLTWCPNKRLFFMPYINTEFSKRIIVYPNFIVYKQEFYKIMKDGQIDALINSMSDFSHLDVLCTLENMEKTFLWIRLGERKNIIYYSQI